MNICQKHWNLIRAKVAEHGMEGLGAPDAENLYVNLTAELEGESISFDPLMSFYWHYMNWALEGGGLYLMGLKENGLHYCAVCEIESHVEGFDFEVHNEETAKAMVKHSRAQGLMPLQ